eukprot:2717356-Rhodomonas_salina.1
MLHMPSPQRQRRRHAGDQTNRTHSLSLSHTHTSRIPQCGSWRSVAQPALSTELEGIRGCGSESVDKTRNQATERREHRRVSAGVHWVES